MVHDHCSAGGVFLHGLVASVVGPIIFILLSRIWRRRITWDLVLESVIGGYLEGTSVILLLCLTHYRLQEVGAIGVAMIPAARLLLAVFLGSVIAYLAGLFLPSLAAVIIGAVVTGGTIFLFRARAKSVVVRGDRRPHRARRRQ
jgi:uncharacterized membrane protein